MNSKFTPPVLNNAQIQEALDCLRLLTTRQEMFRLGNSPIRLLVNGDQRLRFYPKADLQTAMMTREICCLQRCSFLNDSLNQLLTA